MVDYQTWTRIVFEVAKQKGARFSGPTGSRTSAGGRAFERGNDAAQLTKQIAQYWNDHPELKRVTEAEARDRAAQIVSA